MTMELKIWKLDAFADKPFEGNPAAVVPLTHWLSDEQMQAIAAENNLAETAFFVATGAGKYDLRWFTPEVEVPLCGHATLASAYVVFHHLAPSLSRVDFATKSGILTVDKADAGLLAMALPAYKAAPHPDAEDFREALEEALDVAPVELLKANYAIAVFKSPDDVAGIDAEAAIDTLEEFDEGCLVVTAPGADLGFDFVSRFFGPGVGVMEDPVTGSAHAGLVPFWAKRLGKPKMLARQISQRGGTLHCEEQGERVILKGKVAPYLEGVIRI
jgi:PhzF family phenazine biosynthesis protein